MGKVSQSAKAQQVHNDIAWKDVGELPASLDRARQKRAHDAISGASAGLGQDPKPAVTLARSVDDELRLSSVMAQPVPVSRGFWRGIGNGFLVTAAVAVVIGILVGYGAIHQLFPHP